MKAILKPFKGTCYKIHILKWKHIKQIHILKFKVEAPKLNLVMNFTTKQALNLFI